MSLVELATGVHAWLADRPRAGHPNAGVVVDADGTTVIDTLTVPSQYEPFAEAVEALGVPNRRLVLTSSHVDHVGGTSRFRLPAVYGRPQVSVHLDQAADPDVYRRLLPDLAVEFADDFATRPVSHVVDTDVRLTPAVTLRCTGGELVENLVAVVPGAGIAFTGAMASFGVTPLCFQGDPAAWADSLDEIVADAPIIVPGHGPIGGEEEVRDLQAYLRACVAAEGEPAALPDGPWQTWADRHHDAVNVQRAALLAEGRDEIPPGDAGHGRSGLTTAVRSTRWRRGSRVG